MLDDDIKGQLGWIALWANALADAGKSIDFDTVYTKLENETFFHWLRDQGADMTLQVNPRMTDISTRALSTIRATGEGIRDRERKKLMVRNNGYCLLVAIVLQALAIDEEF